MTKNIKNNSSQPSSHLALKTQTIQDFGGQWTHFQTNEGYIGSLKLLQDFLGPLLNTQELSGKRVADIGSGNGRIVEMLMAAEVSHVVAIEPSKAFEVLQHNTAHWGNQVQCLKLQGEALPHEPPLDYVFSLGVIHHIPDPVTTLQAAFRALQPGGRLVIWVYGKEGNELYLALSQSLRLLTVKLPHSFLLGVSWFLYPFLVGYMTMCRWLPLPLRSYMRNLIQRLSRQDRILTIYDQLNPAYAHYYTRDEIKASVEAAGYTDVELYHRHGYSWTVIGTKPGLASANSASPHVSCEE